jgi:hypothetical protein
VCLREIRRNAERFPGIHLRFVKTFTRRRYALGLRGGLGKRLRSASKGKCIVGIQANRFRKGSNRYGEVLGIAIRVNHLGTAQISIEGGRVTRTAELDFGRDIAKERDFQGAGDGCCDLGL